MPLSTVDFEKVDMRLMSLLQVISGLEQQAASLNLPGTGALIAQLDTFRNNVGLEIEKQGQRG